MLLGTAGEQIESAAPLRGPRLHKYTVVCINMQSGFSNFFPNIFEFQPEYSSHDGVDGRRSFSPTPDVVVRLGVFAAFSSGFPI
jgi:hypothetical protein